MTIILKVCATLPGGLNLRSTPLIQDDNIVATVVPADELTALDDFEIAFSKLYVQNQWLHVRNVDGVEGFCAAWFLRALNVENLPGAEDNVNGNVRALHANHLPVFTLLPVDTESVQYLNGFGPNNYSYTQRDETTYIGTGGIHSGLDFGLLKDGFPLYAPDWGVILHASKEENQNPWAAGPYSVIVRYGKYGALYGHMRQASELNPGDVISPGAPVGLSGHPSGDGGPHLHFEIRELDENKMPGTEPDFDERRAKLATLTNNELLNLSGRYLNPQRFFAPSVEIYRERGGSWWPGASTPADTDANGYPDKVIIAADRYHRVVGVGLNDSQPVAFHRYSILAYNRISGTSFWDGSSEV